MQWRVRNLLLRFAWVNCENQPRCSTHASCDGRRDLVMDDANRNTWVSLNTLNNQSLGY
uniref:Uncharacterized protein n=1 Tax=Manihot esculenta TaxID=3983 RepID=A0A251JFS3_MANES